MKIEFPSREFDDAAAAVCDDSASDEQVRALNELLRSDAAARDEYILRLELHSRLASEPDLFALPNENKAALEANILSLQARSRPTARKLTFGTSPLWFRMSRTRKTLFNRPPSHFGKNLMRTTPCSLSPPGPAGSR